MVGDGSKHNGFTNIALNPKRNYRIYLVAESKVGDEVRSGCVVLLQTGLLISFTVDVFLLICLLLIDAVVAKDTSAGLSLHFNTFLIFLSIQFDF